MHQTDNFWNQRYSADEFVYGKEPNVFFKGVIDRLEPGRLLVPAAGEGRDAVYGATLGWKVTAFDGSEEGKRKCGSLAKEKNADVTYQVCQAADFEPGPEQFDLIVLNYFHLPPIERTMLYRRFSGMLRPGGMIVLEAFSKNQLGRSSGGPKEIDWLFSFEDLKKDFSGMRFETVEEIETELSEGTLHVGKAAVVRMIAVK